MLKAAEGEVFLSRHGTGHSTWVLPRCLWHHPRSQLSAGDSDPPTWEGSTGSDLGGLEEYPMAKRFMVATVQPFSSSPWWAGGQMVVLTPQDSG